MTDTQRGSDQERTANTESRQATSSPWLTVTEAARRARCGVKTIYREVRARRLRAARIGGRRELRLRPEWADDWLIRASDPGGVPA
jgi:excisionase family DNA binding protein